ncbi:MAG: hypothetical protein RL205_1919 [Actinomycetota bacterium]|jgi:hypothetical protein
MLKTVGYIDAGTGSYLLAAIASGTAGIWFFIRSKWAQIRGRGPGKATPQVTETTESAPTEQ